MPAIGTQWRALLVTDQRGPVLIRKASTWAEAFAQAHVLLDQAEDMSWFRGELLSVQIAQADD